MATCRPKLQSRDRRVEKFTAANGAILCDVAVIREWGCDDYEGCGGLL
jgi:hypothetical protein